MGYNATSNSFDTLTDLSGQAGTPGASVQVLGATTFNDGGGGSYFWDNSSTTTPNGVTVIQVTGVNPGRWMRSRNNNYGTNSVTFSGITLQTVYTVNHGQSFTPAQIHIQAINAAARSGTSSVENITSTTFQIIFNAIPILGTNNITFNFLAIRGN